ncbi:hypothetical protein ACFX13_015935 [Malus domestica]
MEGIQGEWRFSTKAGSQKLVIESKVLYASAMACTFFFEGIAKRIAAFGYTIYTVDYTGFGLFEGLHGYIPNFDELVDYVIEQFTNVKGRSEVKGLSFFVMGESMGGAISLKIHLKEPDKWDGVIVVAPMCKDTQRKTFVKSVFYCTGSVLDCQFHSGCSLLYTCCTVSFLFLHNFLGPGIYAD